MQSTDDEELAALRKEEDIEILVHLDAIKLLVERKCSRCKSCYGCLGCQYSEGEMMGLINECIRLMEH